MLIAMISRKPDLELFFFMLVGCQTECLICLDMIQEAESFATQEFIKPVSLKRTREEIINPSKMKGFIFKVTRFLALIRFDLKAISRLSGYHNQPFRNYKRPPLLTSSVVAINRKQPGC